jgi:histidyl-tRNA synthetase
MARRRAALCFVEYDGPLLEDLELFKKKSGEEITKQLYDFTDKGGRAVALRPEMTPTLARMAAAAHRDFRKPMKWFCMPQRFRYERRSAAACASTQYNCDIIGEASVEQDATDCVASMCWRVWFHPTKTCCDSISDREFWIDFCARTTCRRTLAGDAEIIDKSEREPRAKDGPAVGELARRCSSL